MVIVKQYTAVWCSPCRALTPIINKVVADNPGVVHRVIDVDANKDETTNIGIRSVPTIIIEKDGVETSRFVGIQSPETYQMAIGGKGTP